MVQRVFPSLYPSPCLTETTPRHFRVLHTPRTFPKKYRSARVSSSPAQVTKFVSITVLDRNDAPTLPSSPYSTNVSEEVPIGTSVFVASASDQDEDSLVYSLSGAGVTHFIIDSNTGIVTTSQVLNFAESSVCIQKEIFYFKSGTDSLNDRDVNQRIMKYIFPLCEYMLYL